MEDFQIGDTVQLKSGSPKMTITDVEEIIIRVIFWNEPLNDFKRTSFESGLLIKTN
jgi:uncharacterized protein YodC (DUF2158 family)